MWRLMSAKIQLLNFASIFGIRCCSFTSNYNVESWKNNVKSTIGVEKLETWMLHCRYNYKLQNYNIECRKYKQNFGGKFWILADIERRMKVLGLEFLTCLKVVSRKVPNGLKRKTFLSKGILKRKTAKIFVSHLLELSLQKHRCKCLYI